MISGVASFRGPRGARNSHSPGLVRATSQHFGAQRLAFFPVEPLCRKASNGKVDWPIQTHDEREVKKQTQGTGQEEGDEKEEEGEG